MQKQVFKLTGFHSERHFAFFDAINERFCQFLFLSIICFFLSGCQNQSNSDSFVQCKHNNVEEAMSKLRSRHMQRTFFSAEQLEALLGKPERIIKALKIKLLFPDNESEDKRQTEIMQAALDQFYSELHGKSTSQPKEPKLSECVLWVYHWSEPITECRTVVGFLQAQPYYSKCSYVYVLYNSVVIDFFLVNRD